MLITANFGAASSGAGAAVFYTLYNADKTEAQARTNSGVIEIGTGIFGVTVADADIVGKVAVWDIAGTAISAVESFPSVWDATMESGITFGQNARLTAAVLHGDATGLTSASVGYKSLDGSKVRVAATQSSGNRTISARDGS